MQFSSLSGRFTSDSEELRLLLTNNLTTATASLKLFSDGVTESWTTDRSISLSNLKECVASVKLLLESGADPKVLDKKVCDVLRHISDDFNTVAVAYLVADELSR